MKIIKMLIVMLCMAVMASCSNPEQRMKTAKEVANTISSEAKVVWRSGYQRQNISEYMILKEGDDIIVIYIDSSGFLNWISQRTKVCENE